MSNTHTFTINPATRLQDEYRIRKFYALAYALRGLEFALSAETFTGDPNCYEGVQFVIRDSYEKTEQHLFDMVDGNGYAEGQDELNAMFQRGILSASDYYGLLSMMMMNLIK